MHANDVVVNRPSVFPNLSSLFVGGVLAAEPAKLLVLNATGLFFLILRGRIISSLALRTL